MSRQRKTLKEKILASLGDVSYMTTREVANSIGVFTETWEVRELLDIMADEGLVEKKQQPLTTSEIEQKQKEFGWLPNTLKHRWVWKRI